MVLLKIFTALHVQYAKNINARWWVGLSELGCVFELFCVVAACQSIRLWAVLRGVCCASYTEFYQAIRLNDQFVTPTATYDLSMVVWHAHQQSSRDPGWAACTSHVLAAYETENNKHEEGGGGGATSELRALNRLPPSPATTASAAPVFQDSQSEHRFLGFKLFEI